MQRANRNAFFFSFIVALGGFVFGLDIALISGTIKYIIAEFSLTAFQVGAIVGGSTGLGSIVALLCAGYFCERFGRKNTLLFIAALYLISALWSAFAVSFETLFAARFLGGLAFASLTLASMYIGEIAPPDLRGKLVGLNQMNIVLGIFIAQLLNFYIVTVISTQPAWANWIGLTELTSWRWMLGSEILPALIWFLLLFFIPESPRWLVMNGKKHKAEAVIAKIAPAEIVAQQFKQICDNLKGAEHSLSVSEQLGLLFKSRLRIALFIGAGAAMLQSLCGMNAVLGYMPFIFSQVGGGDASAFQQTVWVGAIGLFFTFLALVMIDRMGRRPILLWGSVWAAVSMGVVTYCFAGATYMLSAESVAAFADRIDTSLLAPMFGVEYASDLEFKGALVTHLGSAALGSLQVDLLNTAAHMQGVLVFIGLISFVAAFNFSLGPVMWILFSEIFPTRIRGVAIPVCALVCTLFGGVLVPTLFPWQIEVQGVAVTFLIYTCFCVLGAIFVLKMVPETKGKSLEEIESQLVAVK
ncbi:MFS transporter [Cellvibrio sp. QJXJ]|uniref:MFS transporter n=1 Tax=Cellvibrio sp. QJXJ TaxID=2964606 RepID=UPI0021C4A439|nr:MFS transporter [Cellvibrio sp. QJXJ]UUA73796.1 MFS transporter [Cellvibrio sp. QJXJ]